MKHAARLTRIGIWLCVLMAGVLSLQLMGMAAIDRPSGSRLMAARANWESRGFTSYHVVVRIEALGQVCFQRLEIHDRWVRRILENSCETLWIDPLTIEQLFALSSEIDAIPASRCIPSEQDCPCHRVFTLRRIQYDEELGFPSAIIARSEVQLNPMSPDFWRTLGHEGQLPACVATPRRFTIQVLSLTETGGTEYDETR